MSDLVLFLAYVGMVLLPAVVAATVDLEGPRKGDLMGACSPVRFQNVTRIKFEAIKAKAVAHATEINDLGDTGTATGPTPLGPITIRWQFDEPSGELLLQCINKSRLLPEFKVNSNLQSLVGSALNA